MRKYFPQGVLWCKKPEREHGARQPLPLTAAVFFCLRGYAAQSRKARCKKQPERRARLFLCPHAAEQAANGWRPQPCPTTSRLCRAIAQSAMQKNSRSAERGCSSALTPPNRRRMVGARNPALPLAGYAAQSRSDVQTALLPKTQPAAPYAAETSRYDPPLYTYPTKFMHNLCHIVM